MGKRGKIDSEVYGISLAKSLAGLSPSGEAFMRETDPDLLNELSEKNSRRLYKKGHQFCSPSVPAENLQLFLDRLRIEYETHPHEMGWGQVIWEGKTDSATGPSKKEVYRLDCKNITNYVYDVESNSCIFQREMKLGKKVFKELLKDLNGKSGFSDYMVLLSLFESQRHYDSERASQAGYSPKVKVVFGQPEAYNPKWRTRY